MTSSLIISTESVSTQKERVQVSSIRWYALKTRFQHEKSVRDYLLARGIEPFLPLIDRISQWSDRRKRIQVPLFSGYCFARFWFCDRITVLRSPGVISIVGANYPEPIPEQEVEAVQKLVQNQLAYEPHPYFTEGIQVIILRGPLAGVKGQFVRKGTRDFVVIRVHLIQRAVIVHIDVNDVSRLNKAQ